MRVNIQMKLLGQWLLMSFITLKAIKQMLPYKRESLLRICKSDYLKSRRGICFYYAKYHWAQHWNIIVYNCTKATPFSSILKSIPEFHNHNCRFLILNAVWLTRYVMERRTGLIEWTSSNKTILPVPRPTRNIIYIIETSRSGLTQIAPIKYEFIKSHVLTSHHEPSTRANKLVCVPPELTIGTVMKGQIWTSKCVYIVSVGEEGINSA